MVVENYENEDEEFARELNKTIKKVTEDYEAMKFNTAVAQMMTFINAVYKKGNISKEDLSKFLIILNPTAPHVAEELWNKCIDVVSMIVDQEWPKYDEAKMQTSTVEIAVQVGGKVRFTIAHNTSATADEVKEQVLNDERLKPYVEGKEIKKLVIIPGRIANIVV